MMESLLDNFSRFLNRTGASKELRPYERMVVDAWRNTLSPDLQQVVDAQFRAADLIQRQAGDAKVCFYYPKQCDVPLFGDKSNQSHVATVILADSLDGKEHNLRVKLFLVNGRIFSIEFPKRPTRYIEQHHINGEKLRVVSVESHNDAG